ncbi:PKD-like domain-containing protein [Pontibacter toksunensis]|uniref:PKD-like domain-containing protein n=1 Tax=Pontibacter toksunensis TaxID=1332631 RepID=A0ABW6BZ02_9BACT
MQKNFTQLIAHYLSAKRYTVPAGTLLFFIITAIYIQAAVGISITGAASYSLSADLAVTTTFTPITDVVVTEGATTDFASSNSYRIVFTAPTGWVFPGSGVSASRNGTGEVTLTTTPVYTADASGAGARTIEFTLKAGNGAQNKTDIITISGLSIKSTNGVIDPTQPKFVSVQVLNTTNTTPTTVATATPISLSQTPGAPNKLAFVQQPTTVETNTAITPSPSVAIQDRFGNTVSAATNAVTLARTPDTSLSGVLTPGTGSISNGVVTFTGASVNTAGVGYTLVASSSGLTSATSTAFTVNNLRPVITDVVECVTVGDPETTVTVTGSNFVSGATVTFDGVTRAATFVNSTTLTTVLTTADLSSVRDVNVTVNNPLPASNNGVSLPISERVRALFSFPIEGPNAVCANTPNSTAFTTQTGPNVSSYLWAVVSGDATIASGGTTGNPLINFGNAGEVTLSVIAYNFCGKPGPATIRTITVKPRPDVVLDASKTEICQGESVRLSASGADSYQWYGGGLNGTTETEVTVSPTSTLTYTLVGTTDGCSATKTVTINVTPALSQGAITGSTQLCQNQAVDAASALTATVSGGVTAKTYLWEQSPTSLEGSWSSVATTATYAPSTATAGTVYYRRTVNSGSCSVTSDPVAVTVTPAIVGNTIATADQNVCSGDDIALLDGAAATAGSQQVAYFWEQRAAGTSTWANADGTYTNEDYQPATRTVTSASAIEYRRRVEAGNCVSFTDVVSVTVNPRPEATITQGQFTYFCSPGTALLSATEVAGASYTWFRAEANGPVEVANTRTTEVGVVGTYYVVVKYNATTCESTSATISVQETVVGNNIIGTENGDQVVCYNTIPAEIVGSTATSTVGPVTYQWLVSTDNTTFTALTGATGINLSRAQLGAHTADRWYRRMAIVGSCTNTSPETVHISVRPEVLLTSTATPAPICSGETFSYTPATNAAGTSTFAWSRADVAGISNPAATGSGAIAEQLVNTTAMPLEVTYIYRITTENGCESALQYVKVEVNPRPVLNNATTQVAVCSNAPFTYTATTATTSLPAPSFAWTRAAVDGISNVAASGTGATVSETLVNTTTAPVNVTYVYTITANGCAGEPQEVVVTVNPRPVLSSTLAPPAICSGATFGYTPTSATAGATFSWERLAATNITSNGGTTGTGAVNQTLTNSGTAPVEVTYRYTVSANGCAGASTEDVKVTVNPTPQLSSTLTASVCSGSAFSYTPTSATEGATFSWTRAAVTGISNAAVTTPVAGGVSETLVNTTTAPINVTYVYTTSANGCPGTPQNLVVTVDPRPQLSSTLTPAAICSGSAFSYTPTSATAGATFTWTRAAVTGISNAAVTTPVAGGVSETLVNTTTDPINVTYVYTTSRNGCAGEPQHVVVTVNPRPVLSSTLTPPAICSGSTFFYTPTSKTANASFSWERLAAANITSNGGTTGTGAVNQTLTNSGTAPVEVIYRYSTSANGCAGASTQDVKVTVNPTPRLNSALTASVCSGSAFSYTATSATTGTAFSWSRAAVTGISNAAVSNVAGSLINETLVNTTANAINVVYAITMTANGCPSNTQNVTVSVSPNLPVAFTGTIANTNTFYTGQSAVALSAEPTGGVFSSPTAGAVTLSNGVYYFNPCAAKAGTHTITYTRKTGSCTSTVSKTVTVIQSTYRVIITAKPHPFCQGENVDYEAFVYRDASIVYPYRVNDKGEPVDASGALIPKGSGNLPVWNPDYPYPAEASQLVKEQGYRYFKPIITGGERIDTSKFTYQWQKNETQNRKNDKYTTSDAGLSSQDYYNVKVTSKSDALCDAVLTDQVSYRMYSADLPDYEVSLAVSPNPMCTSGPVTLTATLDGDFKFWAGIGLKLEFILTRGSTTYSLGTLPYNASSENPNIIKLNYDPAGKAIGSFLDGDKIHVNFTSDVDKYVGGKCAGKTVSNTVEIKVHQPAVITSTLPTPVEKCEAGSATFTITATGTDLRYAWYKVGSTAQLVDGGKISGATTRSITISNLALTDRGNYYVVVSNGTNSVCTASVTSTSADLIVNPLTRITAQPQPQTVCVGQPASFSVTATGTNIGYQWLKNGAEIPGAISSTYSIPAVTTADAGNYSVRVAGTCGTLTSSAVALTVDTPPTISAQPQPQTVCVGTGATFNVTASGTNIGYQWLKNGAEIPGAIASSYSIPSTTEADAGNYSVRVTGTCGTLTSNTVALTVNSMQTIIPTLESNPDPLMIDEPAVFTVRTNIPSGVEVEYTWYVGNDETGVWRQTTSHLTNLPTDTFKINSVQPGTFDVRVDIKPTNDGANCYNPTSYITEKPISPLPVEILYLRANKRANDVLLEWATASEQDNKGFEVQVSEDGLSYRKLDFVESRNGNSNTKQVYAYSDKEKGKSGTRYYRLKQIDHAGTFEFFGPKVVTFDKVASKVIAFPNPFHDEVTLDIASETDGEMLIVVTDAVGKQLLQRKVQVESGFTTEKLKLDAGLPRGLYIIKTQIGGYTQFIKMIKE